MKYKKQFYVYLGDFDKGDGKPIYYIANTLSEIPEEFDGTVIARYGLIDTYRLKVSRTILSVRK